MGLATDGAQKISPDPVCERHCHYARETKETIQGGVRAAERDGMTVAQQPINASNDTSQ